MVEVVMSVTEWKKSNSLEETHNIWYKYIPMGFGISHFPPPPWGQVKEQGENNPQQLWIVTPTILGMLVGGKAKIDLAKVRKDVSKVVSPIKFLS